MSKPPALSQSWTAFSRYTCQHYWLFSSNSLAVVFASTKMMEPFYQLASPDGALARRLCSGRIFVLGDVYIDTSNYTLWHWVMLLGSIIYFSAGLLAPLAMGVQPIATCHTAIAVDQLCGPLWIAFPTCSMGVGGTASFFGLSLSSCCLSSAAGV